MESSQIRRSFVDYFIRQGHLALPSSSLVPHNDPSVLLTTAGMQQMVPFFLGHEQPPAPRLVTVQKCFRTGDIDQIGNQRTLTFFEMLGNFSVGDYFKEDAIRFAWEFLTQVVGLDGSRLWPTTHPDDEVAWSVWLNEIGIPEDRLTKLEDNWWDRGPGSGPCGPDSEIYFDRGPEHGCGAADCRPGCDCERYLEIWNLVFMEFYEHPDLTRTPLPRKNIDTGMGLERLTMVLQGAPSIYETDLFMPIMRQAAEIAGVEYGQDERADFALRVIGDHSRAVTFLVADGVLPSNEGRGYILRRILRRAVRYGRALGLTEPFLTRTCQVAIDQMGDAYEELRARAEHILRIVRLEEEQFGRTLAAGLSRFEGLAEHLASQGATEMPGLEAFRLYDTYGFPIDLTLELARERGLTVGMEEFDSAMAAQREAGRSAQRFREASHQALEFYGAQRLPGAEFLGYTEAEISASILAILTPDGPVSVVEAGQAVEIVLDRTPFYAEAGGQVGDTGALHGERGRMMVEDTQRPVQGLIAHRGRVAEGFLQVGDRVTAAIDAVRRLHIQRNHTATHLVHRALHLVVGPHATQAGSLVAPDRLRFDFSHLAAVTPEEFRQVEQVANEVVRRDEPVQATIMPLREAMASGAMALFGEKYGDEVRVVSIGDFSRELCGGTHMPTTGQIGAIALTGEASIGSGVRRVEAVTGAGAEQYTAGLRALTNGLSALLRVPPSELERAVIGLQERVRAGERTVEQLQTRLAANQAGGLLEKTQRVNGVNVLAARVEASSMEALKQMGDRLRDQLSPVVVVLGALVNDRPTLLAMASREVVGQGVSAGALVKQVAGAMGGGGGGRPEMGQAGGGDPARLDLALDQVKALVEAQLDKA